MKNLISLFSGILFAVGLVVSGMTDPKKVIGFLDVFREWDFSLAFVMGGAVMVNFVTYHFILKKKPIFEKEFQLPLSKQIDKKLLIGSALFGIGWGIVGICPGPGIVNLVTFDPATIVFIVSLLIGMKVFKVLKI